jgi:hypothetical protein
MTLSGLALHTQKLNSEPSEHWQSPPRRDPLPDAAGWIVVRGRGVATAIPAAAEDENRTPAQQHTDRERSGRGAERSLRAAENDLR